MNYFYEKDMQNLRHIFATYPDATILHVTAERANTSEEAVHKFRTAHPEFNSKFIEIEYPNNSFLLPLFLSSFRTIVHSSTCSRFVNEPSETTHEICNKLSSA
jgi:hypothetical protein